MRVRRCEEVLAVVAVEQECEAGMVGSVLSGWRAGWCGCTRSVTTESRSSARRHSQGPAPQEEAA